MTLNQGRLVQLFNVESLDGESFNAESLKVESFNAENQ